MNNKREHSEKRPAKQGAERVIPEPNKIGASTPYDFEAKNLTAYGGLLPVATMLEKLGIPATGGRDADGEASSRASCRMYQFVLAMVLAVYVGFSRLHHLRFLEREPMLTGILKVLRLPPQCTFWRFLASLHLGVAGQLLEVQRRMRGTGVGGGPRPTGGGHAGHRHDGAHAVRQPDGRAQELQPEEQGEEELSADPDVSGRDAGIHQRANCATATGPRGAQIARHLESVFAALPPAVKTIYARADSGFYCWEAVEAYEKAGAQFIISARKTSRLVEELKAAAWTGLTAHRRRRSMRISLSAGGLGQGLSVHRPALPEASPSRARPRSPSSTSCSTRRSTAIACSSPT